MDDGCPYGYCPNPDIAGRLVRTSAYFTNLFVALIIFHSPEGLKESFWSQILTMYSLLITSCISIFLRKLTRLHAIMAIATAGSPLTFYIVIYAIRSVWGSANRLTPVLGPGHIMPRIIVLTHFLFWTGLSIYIILPSNIPHFAQLCCEQNGHRNNQLMIKYFWFLPIVLISKAGDITLGQFILTLPIQLVVIAWFIAILRRRREIWPRGEMYSPRFYKVWRVVNDNYPFIQFVTVIFVPFGYWVAIIEIGASGSHDNQYSTTFGQVLAIFVTLPPMIQVAMLAPRCCSWFIDLTWVRLLTSRPRRQRRRGSTVIVPVILGSQGRYNDDKKKEPLLSTDYDYKTLSMEGNS